MTRRMMAAFVVGVPLWAGCRGHAPVEPSPMSTFSAASSYSAPSYQPVQVAAATTSPHELVVRAEEVMQAFTLRTTNVAAAEQFAALQEAVASLEQALATETSNAAAVKVVGLRLERASSGKAAKDGVVSLLDGEVVLALPPDASVWDRARLLFGLQRTAARIAQEGLGTEGSIDVSFGVPTPRVADAERYRAPLTERWAQRVRTFIEAAQSPHAPLAIVGCQLPPQITQRPISIERVALSMEPSCRVDVAPPHGGMAPAR